MESPVSVSSSATASGMRVLMNTPPPGGEEPALDLGHTEGGRLRGHDDIAAQQQLEPAGHRGGVRRADDGHARSLPMVKRTKPRMASGLPPMPPEPPSAKPRRSMPAQKARSPVPVSTTARTSGSFSASSMARPMALSSSGFNALRASGRLSRRICTRSPSLLDENRLGRRLRRSVRHQATTFLLADPRSPRPVAEHAQYGLRVRTDHPGLPPGAGSSIRARKRVSVY